MNLVRIVLLLALAGPAAARTHVVAIGSDAGRADEPSLAWAERDADQFAQVMRRLGGAAPQDVVLINGGDAEQVRRALADVQARLGEPDDALIVYYSGHADAAGLHLGDTTLPYDELRAAVEASDAAVRVLILDGCRSGGATRVKGARPTEPFAIDLVDRLAVEGMAVMTSSAAGEDSHESDTLRGSFFTHHLVAALHGAADADGDGRVTLNEAYAYAYRQTLRSSGRTPSLQHPTYAYALKGRGDFVLSRPADARGYGRLHLPDAATYLVRDRDEDGPVRTEVTPEAGGAAVVLPAGDYFVQERRRDHYREARVTVQSGAEVDLAEVPAHRVDYARLVRKGAAPRSHALYALGAAHGPVLDGRSVVPGGILAYGLDLPWLTVSLRARFGQGDATVDGLPSTLRTVGLGLAAERAFDFDHFSVSLGLIAEGLYLHQDFEADVAGADRAGWGGAFGGLAALEIPLFDRISLRLEGGPLTWLFRVAQTDNGVQTGAETTSRFTWWTALGAGIRW